MKYPVYTGNQGTYDKLNQIPNIYFEDQRSRCNSSTKFAILGPDYRKILRLKCTKVDFYLLLCGLLGHRTTFVWKLHSIRVPYKKKINCRLYRTADISIWNLVFYLRFFCNEAPGAWQVLWRVKGLMFTKSIIFMKCQCLFQILFEYEIQSQSQKRKLIVYNFEQLI